MKKITIMLVLILGTISFHNKAISAYPGFPMYEFGCMFMNNWKIYNDQNEIIYSNTTNDCYQRANPFSSIYLQVNKTYRYEIQGLERSGQYYGFRVKVWIDFNANEDFGDSGEIVYSDSSSAYTTLTGYFTVPESSDGKTFRLRAVASYYNYHNPLHYTNAAGMILYYGDAGDIQFTVGYRVISTLNINDKIYCPGEVLDIPYEITGTFNPGNKFIAQLSDANGNFSNPVPLDTINGINSDIFRDVIIPESIISGTQYRVRVVSTNPPITGSDNNEDITIIEKPQPSITQGDDNLCYNSNETYSCNTGSNLSYKWYVDKGQIAGADNNSNVTIHWSQSGTGKLTIIQTNNITNCSDSNFKTIEINPLPVPQISGLNTVCSRRSYMFSANHDNNIQNQWKTACGVINGSGSEENVNITYSSPGTERLKLIQTNKVTGCKDSVEKIITINETPTAVIIGENAVCYDSKMNYKCNSTTNIDCKWIVSGGDITLVNNENIIICWKSTGLGKIKLIQTNESTFCIDSTEMNVNIFEKPVPEIIGEKDICTGNLSYFQCNYNPSYIQTWTVSGGKIIKNVNSEISVKWESVGKKHVKLIQMNQISDCLDSTVIEINVYEKPLAYIVKGREIVYENRQENYLAANDESSNFEWIVTGGKIISGDKTEEIKVKWGHPGKAELILIVENKKSSCRDTLTKKITIKPDKGIYILGELKVCSGYFHEYRTSKPENIELEWIVENAVITEGSIDSIVRVKWGHAGLGKIKVVKTDIQNKFKDSLEYEVLIDSLPAISFENIPEVCQNDEPFQLNCAFPEGGNYSGAGVDANIFYPDKAGSGNIKIRYIYTDMNYCTNDDSTTIKVLPAPGKPFISQIKDTLITSEGFKYQWFFEGSLIDSAVSRSYQPKKEGNYTVQMTGGNGCKSKMSEPYNFEFTDVEDNLKRIKGITIYPNPANEILNIEINDRSIIWEYKSVEIYDVLGKRLFSKDLNSNIYGYDKPMRIDISMINDGFYYIVLSGLDNVISSKFSVIK